MSTCCQPSAALLAANQRLLARRRQLRASTERQPRGTIEQEPPWNERSSQASHFVDNLPPQLGWESGPATAVYRQAKARAEKRAAQEAAIRGDWLASWQQKQHTPKDNQQPSEDDPPRTNGAKTSHLPKTVKLYPDIALGMLQHDLAAVGRVWLLLRALDDAGGGSLALDAVQDSLTQKQSAFRLVGKRQLRKLFRRGEGVFWVRNNGRIWLRSAAKLAASLGVARLSGNPVALPTAVLLDGVGAVRAHFYASFHSGRSSSQNPHTGSPISRQAIAHKTGVSQRTQYAYEQRLELKTRANFAIGPRVGEPETAKAWHWRHGTAAFTLRDTKGRHGRVGTDYHARQLPNSYAGCHRQLPKGKQKHINRDLKDLVTIEAPGNSRQPIKCFFSDGRQAGQFLTRREGHPVYWQRQQMNHRNQQIWYLLAER